MQLIELTGEQQGVLVADKARIHHPILDVGDIGIWDLAPECREKQLRIAFYDRFVVQIDDNLQGPMPITVDLDRFIDAWNDSGNFALIVQN